MVALVGEATMLAPGRLRGLPAVLLHLTRLSGLFLVDSAGTVSFAERGRLSLYATLALAFELTNAALIIGCVLPYFSFTPSPSCLCRLLFVHNGLSQRAAAELAVYRPCLQQHSADPANRGAA